MKIIIKLITLHDPTSLLFYSIATNIKLLAAMILIIHIYIYHCKLNSPQPAIWFRYVILELALSVGLNVKSIELTAISTLKHTVVLMMTYLFSFINYSSRTTLPRLISKNWTFLDSCEPTHMHRSHGPCITFEDDKDN